jgi:hypothetical protein
MIVSSTIAQLKVYTQREKINEKFEENTKIFCAFMAFQFGIIVCFVRIWSIMHDIVALS